MLKISFRHLKGHISFLRKLHLKRLILLIILTFASILVSVMTVFRYRFDNSAEDFTQVNGFQTFQSTNSQGNISITRDRVRIEARNNSFPKAFVYGASGDFKWSFLAFPLVASEDSYPIFFSIEWAQTCIYVWAETGSGWYCSSNINRSLAQNNVSIGGSVTLGSKYDIKIEWDEQPQQTIVNFSLKNEAWDKKLTFTIPEIGIPPAVSLQAWAGSNAHVVVQYEQSVFLSYNSKFTKETDIAAATSIIVSIVLVTITTSALAIKLNEFSSFLKSHLKIDTSRVWGIFRCLPGFLLSYANENKAFIYSILFFAVLRVILAIILPAHWFDMYAFKAWCQVINDKGLLEIYPETVVLPPILGIRPVYPYPPMMAYIFSPIAQVLPSNGSTSDALPVLLKFPPIFAELALAWVTFTAVKGWRGYRAGLIAATLSMLNFVNSCIWGQYESVVALFMVLAVWLVMTGRIELGWVFAALAVATKSTALPFLPGLLVVSVKKWRYFPTLLGIGILSLTTIIVWTPFLLSGYSLNFVLWQSGFGLFSSHSAFTPASSEITKTTVFALNIWPVINFLKDGVPPGMSAIGTVRDTEPNQFLFLTYYQLGILLFVIFFVLVLYSLQKDVNDQSLMEKFSLLMLVFYMFPTRMHERYMYFALPFLPLAYGKKKSVQVFYLLLLATFSVNLLSTLSVQWTPPDVLNFFGNLPFIGDLGILSLTLINISILIMMLYRNIRGRG